MSGSERLMRDLLRPQPNVPNPRVHSILNYEDPKEDLVDDDLPAVWEDDGGGLTKRGRAELDRLRAMERTRLKVAQWANELVQSPFAQEACEILSIMPVFKGELLKTIRNNLAEVIKEVEEEDCPTFYDYKDVKGAYAKLQRPLYAFFSELEQRSEEEKDDMLIPICNRNDICLIIHRGKACLAPVSEVYDF